MKKLRQREVKDQTTVLVKLGFEVRTEGKDKDLVQGYAARLVKFLGNVSAFACAVTPPLAEKNAYRLSLSLLNMFY